MRVDSCNSNSKLDYNIKILIMQNQIVLCLLISIVSPIDIWLRKDNIFIKNSTYYSFKTSLDQSQQQLIPCDITFDHMIENSLATTNQYFDYFTYMSPADLICYSEAIGNKSYLFPCPFLLSNPNVKQIIILKFGFPCIRTLLQKTDH